MEFIKCIVPAAQRIAKEYNILASLIIAQACLESSYGNSGLATKGFNLFGVKGEYKGQSVTMATTEYKDNTQYRIIAAFRKYPSWYESMKDLAELYNNGVSWDHDKYKKIIGEKDFEEAARAVQTSGYATDPAYSYKLLGIYKTEKLAQYDLPNPVLWDGSELKKGQIGRITILKKINLWKRDKHNKLKFVRILNPGERYRVYGYDDLYKGQYNVGGGCWITKMDGYIKYETPSKRLLDKIK